MTRSPGLSSSSTSAVTSRPPSAGARRVARRAGHRRHATSAIVRPSASHLSDVPAPPRLGCASRDRHSSAGCRRSGVARHVHTREVRRRPFDAVVAGVHGRADTALAGAVERAGRKLLVAGARRAAHRAPRVPRGRRRGRPRDAGHRRRCRHGRPRGAGRLAGGRRRQRPRARRADRRHDRAVRRRRVAAGERPDRRHARAGARVPACSPSATSSTSWWRSSREAQGDRSLAGARDAAPLAGDPYPDYHAELDGAREGGRALEPAAYDAPERSASSSARAEPVRSITYAELLAGGADDDELARRDAAAR